MSTDEVVDRDRIAAALRQISRGFSSLADAVAAPYGDASTEERSRRVLEEWGSRGLTREDASALFRKHGFAPQASGGWARGDWIETRADGLRYLTRRSHEWVAERGEDDGR